MRSSTPPTRRWRPAAGFAVRSIRQQDLNWREPVPGSVAVQPARRGFDLPAKHVIHAVGPVWQGGGQGEPALLAGCYLNSLRLLRKAGGRSIAFPAISTGIFGYPANEATGIAVETVREDLARNGDLEVVFCVFGKEMEALYRAAFT